MANTKRDRPGGNENRGSNETSDHRSSTNPYSLAAHLIEAPTTAEFGEVLAGWKTGKKAGEVWGHE